MDTLAGTSYFYVNMLTLVCFVFVIDGGIHLARKAFWPTKAEVLQKYIRDSRSQVKVDEEEIR